jgi:hypothetical protein
LRELTAHIVPGDSANHQLKIEVMDEPGAGNANHRYRITGMQKQRNPSATEEDCEPGYCLETIVLFQNGPIKEVGVNGTTHEAELAILIDRFEGFQKGPYACEDNEEVLHHLSMALQGCQRRTRARIARGVEGTHEK